MSFLLCHCRSFAGYQRSIKKTATKCLKTSTRVRIVKRDVPSGKNTINVNIQYMFVTEKETNKKQIGDKVQGENWINKTYYWANLCHPKEVLSQSVHHPRPLPATWKTSKLNICTWCWQFVFNGLFRAYIFLRTKTTSNPYLVWMVTFLFLAYDLGKEIKQIEIHFELQHTYQRCETEEGKKWTWTIEDNLITYKPENKQEVAYYAFILWVFQTCYKGTHIPWYCPQDPLLQLCLRTSLLRPRRNHDPLGPSEDLSMTLPQ